MSLSFLVLLSACILAVAVLYSSVGHGGASGYIAVLALFSLAPSSFKPTALVLNILVSAVAAYSFTRAGHFSRRLFLPFAATSVPASFLGGSMSLPLPVCKPLIGIILLASAWRLFYRYPSEEGARVPPSATVALSVGAFLGFLSGLTGVGGGIFLSPLLLLFGWAKAKEASAVAAMFILVNSLSGLLGHFSSLQAVPSFAPMLAAAALCGGITGSLFGSKCLPVPGVVKALSLVLAIAGFKLLLV